MSTRTPTSGAVRTRANGSPGKKVITAPIQLRKRPTALEDTDRLALFSVDDTEYSMPKTVYRGDSIKWSTTLNVVKDDDVKGIMLMRFMCGDAAAEALLNEADLTEDEWKNLKDRMTNHAFGPKEREKPEGN